MNMKVGRNITSSTFFREADLGIEFATVRAALRGARPVRGDGPAGGHMNASYAPQTWPVLTTIA
jgi:hypothetical protein